MKKLVFTMLTILILGGIAALLASFTLPYFKGALEDQLLQAVMFTLTDEERAALYQQVAATSPGMWDAVPDPRVARLAKRDIMVTHTGAEVRTNQAGFRSSRSFEKKGPESFRIVCLGDSFVMGQGGLEEDRFCDQIEAHYRDRGITVSGKAIETYAVGLAGWTALQEATYLSTRISAYEPDVVIVLTVGNDITTNYGVTGAGTGTLAFSPEHRDLGSGAFSAEAGSPFHMRQETALSTDICHEGQARWRKAMLALRRLSEVQTRRGGKILNSVSLGPNPRAKYFVEMYKRYYAEHGPATPFVVTSFFRDEETMLPHDSHPNRLGHSYYASHYMHMLDQLGWVPASKDRLPPLDPRHSLATNPAPDFEVLRHHRRKFLGFIKSSIDFTRLHPRRARGFLGGILPDKIGPKALDAPPWASVRSGFLLRRKHPTRGANVVVEIRVPPRPELFPFRVEMILNGKHAETFDYPEPSETGRYVLEAAHSTRGQVVEVVLRTDSYFSEIDDHRMKSFQLLSAEVRSQ